VAVTVIFFTMSATMVAYFYQFPPFDVFRDSSVYRNVFFELTKTIKEADSIKNIYSNEAIYIQVKNNIYAYRLNKTAKRLEKSVDGGYNWFLLPNCSNIEAINFRAPTPYSSAKIVHVSYKSFYPSSKLSKYHQFIVKIRKEEKEEEVNYVISGINPNNQIVFSIGNTSNWQNFVNVSNRTSLNTLNLDTFISSYNICAPVRVGSSSTYQLWKFTKQNPNSSFSYELDTVSSFNRGTTDTSPGADNDWLKVISVGDYLYTAYAVIENLYTPSNGTYEQYYSVYFAYRKIINIPTDYGGNYEKSSWIKRKIFYVRKGDIGNGDVRFVRIAYGQAVSNKFHITFCVGNTNFNPGLNDFYYARSPDGINWNIKNIDDSLLSDNLNPLFVVPLVGTLNGTSNTLHFVFVNYIPTTGNNFNISYLSTNDLENFTLQNLNTDCKYGLNGQDQNFPITIDIIRDFEALLYDNSIHLVFGIQGRSGAWNNNLIYKLIYMVKQDFNNPAVYNIYPTANSSIPFNSSSISIGGNYVHIVASSGATLYYIRNTLTYSLTQNFSVNSYNQGNNMFPFSIDTFYSHPYLYVSFYLRGLNHSTRDLNFIRISNFTSNTPLLQRINNRTIDDNLTIPNSSIDGNVLLSSDNVTNGVMSGLTISSKGYLHFLTFCANAGSLGEIIYTDPANSTTGTLPSNGKFDTLLVHRSTPYYRSINVANNGVISYADNDTAETTAPAGGKINDIKVYIDGFITEIDGNRRFDINNNTDIPGSRSCGFYNDIQNVDNTIYVAYSELIGSSLRLRLATSNDKGQTWNIETVNSSNSARDINLIAKGNILNIVHRNSLNNLIINKKVSGSWVGYSPALATNNFNIRTFLDSQNRLHILSFSSNDPNNLTNQAYYRVFDNSTNTFLDTGLTGDSLLLVPNYATTFSSLGPYGDILVDGDTVLIVVNSRRVLQNNYSLDLLVYKDGQWQDPIPLPPSSPIDYLLTSLRINKW
ncbi:MAG: hypothetical protein ACK4GJ_04725, partial [bacterium]